MKKLISNPMSIVFLVFATVLIGSNVCCTGKASNNEKNTTTTTDETSSAKEPADAVVQLTDQTFDAKISTGVVIVDFWATWCKPCRRQAPVMEEVAKDMAGKATVGKLDIDAVPSIANRYGVESIPTMIIFKDGKVVGQFVGQTAKEDIIAALKKQLE